MIESFWVRLIRTCFYSLFFLTPLILTPWNFELFEFNKMMLVYFFTIIISGSWAIHIVINWSRPGLDPKRPGLFIRRTPFDIPLLLFLFSQTLSTIFSLDRHTSLFGYYSRFHGGLLSTISYLILFYAFVTFGAEPHQASPDMDTIRVSTKSSFTLKGKHKKYSKKPLNPLNYLNYLNPFVRKCLNLLLTSAALVSVYAIAEHFGIDKHLWVQDVQTRVFSTLGQPNWLAAFLITVLPLTLALSVRKLDARRYTLSPIYIILFSLYFLSLLFTKSRSGILGFALMYSLFWGLVFLKTKLPGKSWSGSAGKSFPYKVFLVFTFSLLALSFLDGLRWIPKINSLRMNWEPKLVQLFNPNHLITQLPNYLTASPSAITPQPTPPPSGGTQLETGGTESGDIRRIVWQGAINVFRRYPVFGSGVETFAYSYYNFRPREHNLVSEWDFLYNKAHNEYLNFLATTGAVGLATYLFLQASVFFWLLKKIFSGSGQVNKFVPGAQARQPAWLNSQKSTKDSSHTVATKQISVDLPQLINIALFSALAGLSVSNFFGFSTVPVALLFFLYPAIAITLTDSLNFSKAGHPERAKRGVASLAVEGPLSNTQKLYVATLLLATGYMLFATLKWWYTDTRFALGKKYSEAGYAAQAFPLLQTAVKLMPQEPNFHSELSEAASDLAVALASQEATQAASQAATLALQESDLTQQLNPVHLNFVKSRARVFFTLAQIDPRFYQQALEALLRGLELSPTDAKLMYNLGLLYLQLDDPQKALETLQQTIDLKTNYEAARFALGSLYEELGQTDLAREQYQYILDYITPNNQRVLEKLQGLR